MSCNKPQVVKINVSFSARVETNAEYMGYIDHPYVDGTVHTTAPKAKKKLQQMLAEQVEEGLRTVHTLNHYRPRLIVSVNGEVLVVSYRHGSWGYYIARRGVEYACSSIGGKDFDDVVEQARRHANSSYDGILWESIL
jgi:hypothetical protein